MVDILILMCSFLLRATCHEWLINWYWGLLLCCVLPVLYGWSINIDVCFFARCYLSWMVNQLLLMFAFLLYATCPGWLIYWYWWLLLCCVLPVLDCWLIDIDDCFSAVCYLPYKDGHYQRYQRYHKVILIYADLDRQRRLMWSPRPLMWSFILCWLR